MALGVSVRSTRVVSEKNCNFMDQETIFGQVIAKANNYLSVPDGKGERRIIKNESIRQYERSFFQQCRIYRNRRVSSPFILHATVFQSSWSYDLDNSVKTLLDCLQQVNAITNDNLCIEIRARKAIDRSNPRVVFRIEETQPRLL